MAGVLTSAGGVLALLDEQEPQLQTFALTKLNDVVDEFWPEISEREHIEKIEMLQENKDFASRELAALVASKVYYHLGAYDDSVTYALGAGSLLDLDSKSEYVLTILSKCIDQYTAHRQAGKPDGELDSRLVTIVEGMFERCMKAKQYRQAVGIALETRRVDIFEKAITASGEDSDILSYCFTVSMTLISHRGFRNEVLRILARLYSTQSTADHFGVCQCFIFLDDAQAASDVVVKLLKNKNAALAFQIAFDLYNNATQQFLAIVKAQISDLKLPSTAEDGDSEPSTADVETVTRVENILSGKYTLEVYKEFLSRNNNTDKLILNTTKDGIPTNSVYHSALVMSNALMYAGTTQDPFLRDNRDWLRRASNWAKFSVVASIGVIHKGHTAQARKVLEPYLPGAGEAGGTYVNGGAFFALGLIYANHGEDITPYLMEQLATPGQIRDVEVMHHGCCLGLGLAAMATQRQDVASKLRDRLEATNAVIGEAASIGLGLVMLGSGDKDTYDCMYSFAKETQHEKIIRGIAVGSALLMYGRQEEADAQIEQLCGDEDPILRMAGCHTIATAYAGTDSNKVIKTLLHIAVSDVSNDVRRSAVTSLGFVLCRSHDQLPSTVMLLCESFNPHVRYGSCMALGIACAGTGNAEALSLVEPLIEDPVGYVRQGALIAMALIMMQQPNSNPKSKWVREQFVKIIADKRQDILAKFGAIYAQGLIECGGRNVTARLINEEGHIRMQAVVGMLLFSQFWFWFPLGHCISLALTPTTMVCLNTDLKMPKNVKIKSNAPPSKYAYPPATEPPKEKSKEKVETAVLSTTSKTKAKAKAKKDKDGKAEGSMDTADDAAATKAGEAKEKDASMDTKDDDAAKAKAEESKAAEPEAAFQILENPARVVAAQLKDVTFEDESRYTPVRSGQIHQGIIILKDSTPDQPEDLIEIAPAAKVAPVGEAEPPEPFVFDKDLEDE